VTSNPITLSGQGPSQPTEKTKSLQDFVYSYEPREIDAWDAFLFPEDTRLLVEKYYSEVVGEKLIQGEMGDTNPGSKKVLGRLIQATSAAALIGHDLKVSDSATVLSGISMVTAAFADLNLEDIIKVRRRRRWPEFAS
jgi:hypothetical protein